MHKLRCNRRSDIWRSITLAAAVLGQAPAPASSEEGRALQLEVLIGGKPTGLIGAFQEDAQGALSATRTELEELSLKAPDHAAADEMVPLSALPELRYRYDEAAQTLDIEVADSRRLAKLYDARGAQSPLLTNPSSTGVVLNYLLFGGGGRDSVATNWQFQGASATLDGRLFSPFGIVSQSGILAKNSGAGFISEHLRLDSAWSYTDSERALSYRAGDAISGALAWTRPIRLGGLQVQRDFAARPDLVTLPLASFSGSAAVPSTVDVYVNNVRTLSQDVGSGPFRITNLPILSGHGDASIVVRDSSGREVETTLPFFVSSKLLRAGLFDFSAEAGFPRLFYGARSNVYGEAPAGSGSFRYGISDGLTLEGHAESTRGLANAGVGAAAAVNALGLFSGALAGSRQNAGSGGQIYASFETNLFGMSFSASTQRTFGNYIDLATITAAPSVAGLIAPFQAAGPAAGSFLQSSLWSLRPPRIQDQLSIGFPLLFDGGSVNLAFVRAEDQNGSRAKIVNMSYSRQLFDRSSLFATAYADFGNRGSKGLSLGVSIPLGDDVTASTGANRDGSGAGIASEMMKPLKQEPGSYGWRLRDREGRQPLRQASAAYRGNFGKIEASVAQSRTGFGGTIANEGALVAADGDVFLANRIDDAFAIVDAGAPDLEVFSENRPVARTNGSGKAIVPTLKSHQRNKVSIDPGKLPLNASIATTQEVLAPPDRGGVVVDFGIKIDSRSAIVILEGADGQPLRTGLRGKLENGRGFVVGYDGRAFIEGLEANNIAIVRLDDRECRAEFAFVPRGGDQVLIGPAPCK